jgi:DNA-binding LacI/PurR family transcriptional regulator
MILKRWYTMKKQLTQITKPGETYIRLGHMIKKMAPGDRMPPFSKLLRELGITQRSLDIAYDRLVEEGVLEIKKQSGVFVKKPYAGGTFLFAAAEDVFLSHRTGENLRLYFAELRRKIHHYFPESRLEIVLSESPDKQHYDREPQLCEQLVRENKLNRILGAFVSYHVTEQETIDVFNSLGIPFVDLEGESLKITNCFYDATVMVERLKRLGYKKIVILGGSLREFPQFDKYLEADSDLTHYPIDTSVKSTDLVECGIRYIKDLIDSNNMPDAFAICDDYFCQGVLIGAYIKGVKLEEEYGLITISQQDVPIHSNTPVMRLNYCWSKIADVSSKLMSKKLLDEEINEPVKVVPELEI